MFGSYALEVMLEKGVYMASMICEILKYVSLNLQLKIKFIIVTNFIY